MREKILAEFFSNRLSAADLAVDLKVSVHRVTDTHCGVLIEDMGTPFCVTRGMAVLLCDAVLQGELPAESLETIGFALVSSDAFFWSEDEEEPAETFHDWACPQINYALTLENVQMFRRRLTEEPKRRSRSLES